MLSTAKARYSAPKDRRARLRQIILEQSVLRGRTYRLASGRTSDVYFAMKKTMLDPEGANLIADEILDILEGEQVDFIGGLAMGAVPIVSAVCQKSYERRPIRGFFVRKEAKGHGTEDMIDGHLEPRSRVVLFDDVTTTGGSVLRAVDAVRKLGCRVSKVITLVDRQEGAEDNLAEQGVALLPLFTKDELIR